MSEHIVSAIICAIMQCDDFGVYSSAKGSCCLCVVTPFLLVADVVVADVSRVITLPLSARFAVAAVARSRLPLRVRPPAAKPARLRSARRPTGHRRAKTAGCQIQLVPPRRCPPTPRSLPIRHALTKSVMQ